MLIRPFSDITKADALFAGGKGASLGEMTKAGIPVPPGFVILSEAFEQFLQETDLSQEIDAILHTVDTQAMHTVEHASERIQKLILEAKMPQDITSEILKYFGCLGAEYVAVRSSATAEDSASAAWAGQLDSFLNTTKETLLQNVQRCWASLFTPRAIFYRFEQGLHDSKISVAVVVQQMVASEVSGIAFSVHPVTEDRNQLIIEAGYGLGEAIVSGQITPDSYVVEKEPRRIIDKNLAKQERGIFRAPTGGNAWKNIEPSKQEQSKLSDEQILELSEIIITIEKHYGFPCDIEWAYVDGKFYIVQSRPITTLSDDLMSAPTVLSKVYSRKKSLLYFSVWHEADVQGLQKYLGTQINLNLFVLPPEGDHEVWYSTSELEKLQQLALQQLQNDPALVKRVISDLDTAWATIKPYFVPGKELESLEEAESYYGKLVDFWAATNTIFFELPNYGSIPPRLKQGLLHVREESQEHTDEMSDKFERFFERTFPAFKQYAHLVTMADIESWGSVSSRELLDILEERLTRGCFIFRDQVLPLSELVRVKRENNFSLEKVLTDHSATEVLGTTAHPGIARGHVKILFGTEDTNKIVEGDVLVAPMTKAGYLPMMERAAAFVTDEGGVTCHAAIVAREMKKPCIIGTRVATQVLKDGDLVEVDADNGLVRVVEAIKAIPNLSEYVLTFESGGARFLFEDIVTQFYCPPDSFGYYRAGVRRVFMSRERLAAMRQQGVNMTIDDLKMHAQSIDSLVEQVNQKVEQIPKKGDREASVREVMESLGQICAHYYFFDAEFWDEVFLSASHDRGARKKAEYVAQEKNRIRADLDPVFFADDGCLSILLERIGNTVGLTADQVAWYRLEEILPLLRGVTISEAEIKNRQKAYAHFSDGKLYLWSGNDAISVIESFSRDEDNLDNNRETFQGMAAHSTGKKVTGRVKVIIRDYQDPDRLDQAMETMQVGEILVSPTTEPQMMPALSKAAAVVADMGGLLSHSAIVARELNIPCIVGTGFASRILKDGDLVEVDAEKGIVTIIEKSN